jgi:hypothetical protein
MYISNKRTRQILESQYQASRRTDEHEPSWVHPFYEAVLSGAHLDKNHRHVAAHVRAGRVVRTEWMGMPRAVGRNGWKIGTTTWIFMRRADPDTQVLAYRGWTLLGATFDGVTYWMAYDDDHRPGDSVMTDGSVGPTMSKDDIKDLIDHGAVTAGERAMRDAVRRAEGRGLLIVSPTANGDIPLGHSIEDIRGLPDEEARSRLVEFLSSE